jgi:pilus assembly protein CpaC
VIAVGDPTVVEFEVLPNPRMIRVLGRRAGVTDLSITTAGGESYNFEIRVVYDLPLLKAQLKQAFPDAVLNLVQIREHLVVEGQARTNEQVTRIIETIQAFLESVQVPHATRSSQPGVAGGGGYPIPQRAPRPSGESPSDEPDGGGEAPGRPTPVAGPGRGGVSARSTFARPRVINLIRVPGIQQVLLQVRIAELNRTGLREIGADLGIVHPDSGAIGATNIAGAAVDALSLLGAGGLAGEVATASGNNTTVIGIFNSSDFEVLLRALRRNSLATILAEPNLMALSGHEASFLAGGQFPVPVPQTTGGASNTVTVEFKDFGVQLDFVPYVLDDDTIRISVRPEVSTIDFRLGTTLVVGGDPVPGLNTRTATTTVELKKGQTLAIAGLLQVTIEGQTDRIPGLGDLPYIGPLFSNTSNQRTEKELLVLVTPHMVSPMEPHEVPPLPGDNIKDPNDLEFYLLNRIEGRTGREFRSTLSWDCYYRRAQRVGLEKRYIWGEVGLSE